jgi:hypothetical protein
MFFNFRSRANIVIGSKTPFALGIPEVSLMRLGRFDREERFEFGRDVDFLWRALVAFDSGVTPLDVTALGITIGVDIEPF